MDEKTSVSVSANENNKKPPQGAGSIKELVFGDVVNAPNLPSAVPVSWVKRPGAAEDFFDIRAN